MHNQQQTQQKQAQQKQTQQKHEQSEASKLKAERVQLRADPKARRSPAVSAPERLELMPGWQLARGGRSIESVREFVDARTAAAYAGFLLQLAVHQGQPLGLDLSGPRLTMTVRSRSASGGGVTADILEFARGIG